MWLLHSCIDDHAFLECQVGSQGKLVLGPSQHMLDVLIIQESCEIPLLLALLQQSRPIIHQNHQMTQFKGCLGVRLLDGNILLPILQEEV